MALASAGYEPTFGESLEALPFPSAEHQERVSTKVASVARGKAAGATFHPLRALQAAVVAEPNVIVHLRTSIGVGAGRDVVLAMAAVKITPPRSSESPYHVLMMGHERLDPRMVSLWAPSDVASELTSDTGSDSFGGGGEVMDDPFHTDDDGLNTTSADDDNDPSSVVEFTALSSQ